MALAKNPHEHEFDGTCNTVNNVPRLGRVNNPTPFCLRPYRSKIAQWGSNLPLFSTAVFHNLFAFCWEFCHLCTSCNAIVCVHRCIHWPGNQCIGEKDCQMSLNHNCCRKLLLYQFLWSPLFRIVDIALNLHLRPIGTIHWGTLRSLAQLAQICRQRKVGTRRCCWSRCYIRWDKVCTLIEPIDL